MNEPLISHEKGILLDIETTESEDMEFFFGYAREKSICFCEIEFIMFCFQSHFEIVPFSDVKEQVDGSCAGIFEIRSLVVR